MKINISKNRGEGYWQAVCPCGWWHVHQSWALLCQITARHRLWSTKHAAHNVANDALDRFNVGGKP